MYEIRYAEGVAEDLRELRAYERKLVLNAIETQLRYEPTVQTRHRKILVGLIPPWEHVEPVWQLQADEFWVFYDVNEDSTRVIVRAIRRKPLHRTTEDIL
ncbi:MAG: hypothetical protein NTW86_17275 [Candidatus Sumerlaeota bacterium]|nr:hypothetical protein [Candidatus Sumerlaeota bacterium]